jgi:hypothetical protein
MADQPPPSDVHRSTRPFYPELCAAPGSISQSQEEDVLTCSDQKTKSARTKAHSSDSEQDGKTNQSENKGSDRDRNLKVLLFRVLKALDFTDRCRHVALRMNGMAAENLNGT